VLADAAELVAALSMEATRGNPSIALPVVAEGKPFPGLGEACRQLRAALEGETERNAQADTPLVSPSDGTMVSNGNFHPVLLAVAFDALRVAIAHVGQLSDRRLGHLWAGFLHA